MIGSIYILIAAAFIPLAVGFFWYGKMGFESAWMKASGVTREQMQSGNMGLIFVLSLFFSFLLAYILSGLVIHQAGVMQLFAMQDGFGVAGAAIMTEYNGLMDKYGGLHRSFGHGVVHGGLAAVGFALPLIAINALFERRGWKYIMIHFGYWFIVLCLMGGVICQWH